MSAWKSHARGVLIFTFFATVVILWPVRVVAVGDPGGTMNGGVVALVAAVWLLIWDDVYNWVMNPALINEAESSASLSEFKERTAADRPIAREFRQRVAVATVLMLISVSVTLVLGCGLILSAQARLGLFRPSKPPVTHYDPYQLIARAEEHLVRETLNVVPGIDAISTLHWTRDPWPYTDVFASTLTLVYGAVFVFLVIRAALRIGGLMTAEGWHQAVSRMVTEERFEKMKRRSAATQPSRSRFGEGSGHTEIGACR